MAFKIEYLKTKEELSKLGVDDYESELTRRITFNGKKDNNLWSEFPGGHFIHIDAENDMWLICLGAKIRSVRHFGEYPEDIFLFNYKGSIIELLLQVEAGTPERMFNRTFGVRYTKIVEMNPQSLPEASQKDVIQLICEAFQATEVGKLFLAEYGEKLASKLIEKEIICNFVY